MCVCFVFWETYEHEWTAKCVFEWKTIVCWKHIYFSLPLGMLSEDKNFEFIRNSILLRTFDSIELLIFRWNEILKFFLGIPLTILTLDAGEWMCGWHFVAHVCMLKVLEICLCVCESVCGCWIIHLYFFVFVVFDLNDWEWRMTNGEWCLRVKRKDDHPSPLNQLWLNERMSASCCNQTTLDKHKTHHHWLIWFGRPFNNK